jgi:hypothetical protein
VLWIRRAPGECRPVRKVGGDHGSLERRYGVRMRRFFGRDVSLRLIENIAGKGVLSSSDELVRDVRGGQLQARDARVKSVFSEGWTGWRLRIVSRALVAWWPHSFANLIGGHFSLPDLPLFDSLLEFLVEFASFQEFRTHELRMILILEGEDVVIIPGNGVNDLKPLLVRAT